MRISMHSLRYIEDTYEAACDTIHPCYEAVRFDFDSTQCDSMQWEKYDRIYFFGSDRQQIINVLVFWLLTPWGLFQKTRLSNRPGLFQLVWLAVKWFGSIKQI